MHGPVILRDEQAEQLVELLTHDKAKITHERDTARAELAVKNELLTLALAKLHEHIVKDDWRLALKAHEAERELSQDEPSISF